MSGTAVISDVEEYLRYAEAYETTTDSPDSPDSIRTQVKTSNVPKLASILYKRKRKADKVYPDSYNGLSVKPSG